MQEKMQRLALENIRSFSEAGSDAKYLFRGISESLSRLYFNNLGYISSKAGKNWKTSGLHVDFECEIMASSSNSSLK